MKIIKKGHEEFLLNRLNEVISLNKIESKIAEKGLKKGWIAKEVGIAPGTLTKIVKGESIPTLPVALRLADTLDTSVEFLFGHVRNLR